MRQNLWNLRTLLLGNALAPNPCLLSRMDVHMTDCLERTCRKQCCPVKNLCCTLMLMCNRVVAAKHIVVCSKSMFFSTDY